MFYRTMISGILVAAIVGVLAWLATHWVGKPISDMKDKRSKALQAAEQNSLVGGAAGGERVAAARVALSDAASGLRSISRGHPWPVRLYCRFFQIDLEAAASALIELHNMTGDHGYNNEGRRRVLDVIYVLLDAHRHLSRERVDEIRRQVERDKRLNEAKF